MQSPACCAGPCRMATSLWLRFVASPQRMPDIGYRRVSIPVVDVIDRSPSVVSYNSRCRFAPIHESHSPTVLGYAGRGEVSSRSPSLPRTIARGVAYGMEYLSMQHGQHVGHRRELGAAPAQGQHPVYLPLD